MDIFTSSGCLSPVFSLSYPLLQLCLEGAVTLDKPCADKHPWHQLRVNGGMTRAVMLVCVLSSLRSQGNSTLFSPFPRLTLGKPQFGSITCSGRNPSRHGIFRNSWICSQGPSLSTFIVVVTVENSLLVLVATDPSHGHHSGQRWP